MKNLYVDSDIIEFCSYGSNWQDPSIDLEIASRRIGDKSLAEPLLAWFTEAYMRYYGEMTV